MHYTIHPYSKPDVLGNLAFVLTDHNGNTFHGDSYWQCIDKFLSYYGG